MVLETIGLKRFLGKVPNRLLRLLRIAEARLPLRNRWSCKPSVGDGGVSVLSGRWLYGSSASLDTLEFTKVRQCILERAEKAKQKIFHINGRELRLNSSLCLGRWDVDPFSGDRWPQGSVFSSIGRHPGDIRFPWELDRLHHLAWFGQAWRFTGNLNWVLIGISHIEEILSEAAFEHGIHWRDGLQLAVRIYSLAVFADLCHDAPDKTHSYITKTISLHAYALSRQMSPYSEITNNHAIGESCGLALAGIYLQSENYLASGLNRLRVELKRQLYPDGIPYEGSIPYIRFDLDFLSLLALAMRGSDRVVPEWLLDSIAKIGSGLSALADLEGGIPPIGDGDDARVIRLDDEPYLNVNESLHVAGKLVSVSLAPAFAKGSFALWSVGPELLKPRLPIRMNWLSDSGLLHLNRGALDLWLDCGPTGYGLKGPGGHGHNDTTALVVHHSGKALLHDPGWYTYYGDRSIRDKLRGTRAHNTVCIDDQEQARLGGLFEILDDCQPTKVRVREFGTATVISCGHSGYSRLGKGVLYRRVVIMEGVGPWQIRVTDIIRSNKEVNIKSHLGSDFLWAKKSKSEWVLPGRCVLNFRSGFQDIRLLEVPCSRETGSLMQGSALEWKIPMNNDAPRYSYVSRWKMRVLPAG